jgi:hypothetical protein
MHGSDKMHRMQSPQHQSEHIRLVVVSMPHVDLQLSTAAQQHCEDAPVKGATIVDLYDWSAPIQRPFANLLEAFVAGRPQESTR